MNAYKIYLENKGFAASTVNQYVKGIESLLLCSQQHPEQLHYTDLLAYINLLKKQGKNTRTINQQLSGFRHYFAFLMQQGICSHNPAAHLKVKGSQGNIQGLDWLPFEELEELYTRYLQSYPEAREKHVLLSLLIYQGLSVSDLRLLHASDIDLDEGKIAVPESRQSNGRQLALDRRQILLLVRYMGDRKGLLFDFARCHSLVNRMTTLVQHLRKLHPGILNSRQIRRSVIIHWLKSEDLRIVQYKAGHRYVSSTERYQVAHLAELQQEVSKVHPLG